MSNKKIGILTFHQALSYGAKLQAYALQNFLTEQGIDNEMVDYTCDYMYKRLIRPIRVGTKRRLRSFVRSLITMKQTGIDRRKSIEFRQKYMKLSRPYTEENIADATNYFDAFITGSDQVWSPVCVGFDPVYFLNFAKPEQKYSYAASIGEKVLPEDKKADYEKLLADFQRYSVRESSAAEIIKDLNGRDAQVHVDPTLLLSAKQWDKIVSRPEQVPETEPFIFLFNVKRASRLFEYAKYLSEKTGLKVYYLQKQRIHRLDFVTYLDPVMANEFVWLIKNAKYVVTNSFHGTVFSVIYKKEFAVEFDHYKGRNIRAEELLQDLHIYGREITKTENPDPSSPVDWDYVDERIAQHRQNSLDYINTIAEDLDIK